MDAYLIAQKLLVISALPMRLVMAVSFSSLRGDRICALPLNLAGARSFRREETPIRWSRAVFS